MARARFFAAYLNLIIAGAMFIGSAVFAHDAEAAVAARRATKPIRRTASAPPHVSATNATPAARRRRHPSERFRADSSA